MSRRVVGRAGPQADAAGIPGWLKRLVACAAVHPPVACEYGTDHQDWRGQLTDRPLNRIQVDRRQLDLSADDN
jgi:hypothetical protein